MRESGDFQGFVEEVCARNDIVEVISEYTKLKRTGVHYMALCPLHNDKKSPSLSISQDKQVFHCFGCGVGGNVIHFIMAMQNLEFMDALKYLADRAHLPMPEQGSAQDKAKARQNADKRQKIYEINAEAARYFHHCLASDAGKDALDYLHRRELSHETIKKFGLGYAPRGWTSLLEHLQQKGFAAKDICDAGLAKARDNGTFYDAFYDGRVMFPIINVQGKVIGFGGRTMDPKEDRKYINTSETLAFRKKENLFGLNYAKNDKSGVLLLMEGYMDVISLHQAGIGNAVASCGTAFTEEQARLIKKYAGKVILCYDTDDAGKKATLRNGDILREAGVKVKVMSVTDGKDPDEFIRAKGADMFRVLLEQAKPLVVYKIDELKQKYDREDPEQLLEFTEGVAQILAELDNAVELELYLKIAAKETGISPESLAAQVKQYRKKHTEVRQRQEESKQRRAYEERTGGRKDLSEMGRYNAERLLLNLMAESDAVRKKVREAEITSEDFSRELHRSMADKLFQLPEHEPAEPNRILAQFPPEQVGEVAAILMDNKNTGHVERAYQKPLETLCEFKRKAQESVLLHENQLDELDKMLKAKKKKN